MDTEDSPGVGYRTYLSISVTGTGTAVSKTEWPSFTIMHIDLQGWCLKKQRILRYFRKLPFPHWVAGLPCDHPCSLGRKGASQERKGQKQQPWAPSCKMRPHIYPSQGPVDFVSQVDELLVSPGVGKISLTSWTLDSLFSLGSVWSISKFHSASAAVFHSCHVV